MFTILKKILKRKVKTSQIQYGFVRAGVTPIRVDLSTGKSEGKGVFYSRNGQMGVLLEYNLRTDEITAIGAVSLYTENIPSPYSAHEFTEYYPNIPQVNPKHSLLSPKYMEKEVDLAKDLQTCLYHRELIQESDLFRPFHPKDLRRYWDWCEEVCPRYSQCQTIAEIDDEIKELEEPMCNW